MERFYNRKVLIMISAIVVLLNLIFPKPNIPMITINLLTCLLLAHACWWISKHYEELEYLSIFNQRLVNAAMYYETGQIIYRYTLRGDIDKFFIYDTDLKIWYGLNTSMKNREFLYTRISSKLQELGLKIHLLDEEYGHKYVRRSHYVTCFDSCEKEQESRVREKNAALRERKEKEGYNFIDNQKPIGYWSWS